MTPHEFFYFMFGMLIGIGLMGVLAMLVIMRYVRPKRNCDVGTVAEQYKRFRDVCDSKDAQQCSYCELRGLSGLNCSRDKCYARWSQMPYKPTGK